MTGALSRRGPTGSPKSGYVRGRRRPPSHLPPIQVPVSPIRPFPRVTERERMTKCKGASNRRYALLAACLRQATVMRISGYSAVSLAGTPTDSRGNGRLTYAAAMPCSGQCPCPSSYASSTLLQATVPKRDAPLRVGTPRRPRRPARRPRPRGPVHPAARPPAQLWRPQGQVRHPRYLSRDDGRPAWSPPRKNLLVSNGCSRSSGCGRPAPWQGPVGTHRWRPCGWAACV